MSTENPHKSLGSRKAFRGIPIQETSDAPAQVTMFSSALCVMTDFRKVPVASCSPGDSLPDATQIMVDRGVRLLLVIDEQDGVVGLITARDTQGERPIKFTHERGVRHGDIQVRDLMVPASAIDLLDMHRVMNAQVGDIVATLKAWGRQHALVGATDPETGQTRIRGMFSATQIGRQLGLQVQTFDVAHTFAEIQAVLTKAY